MELTIVMLTLNVSTQMEVSSVSVKTVTLEAELFAEVNRTADHCWIDIKLTSLGIYLYFYWTFINDQP